MSNINVTSIEVWDSLKQAIALTSGFKRWQLEHKVNSNDQQNILLDRQVSLYLRETLETLAY
ncbi:MAG: hypothetical protein O4861_06965 [Trichodesmium sp. St16_bin4-tuft]|uniref:Uncharacterized protein n=1 Tax=Trichodesmium erythraeum (strain IMS101) TaxID=203124 RepID=Q10XM4_TRIEI|nr:hypothetical protein [Trichodesmium erythraeum GBRTRLIN201]MCH2048304.1 hypothetical protein [Trichodesmium sp. ALOHA_ZT_67]MCL2927520.1 hypothetical protein [Trichodesmium sp. MAG_R01]MDE5067650.1 hypothetical protein [Trichodesmium sp. St4_bin8_1]MDE5073586.1 hypothetical protein [Trichodesmium sp. St5_bin8]MDE5091261.1 hypothetical protein [Trichodesmium sp. St18_bin3_1_1]MDE5096225.1 hypothetical protein [Trichodesmium sp. St11_bin5]MDE5098087.1 hypothetical protein [Trichodesmium sp.